MAVAQFGDHAVRGHLAVAVGGGTDGEFGAAHQGVAELAVQGHGGARNGPVMRRDEVHQTE
jgi:hypothetical protein